MEESRKGALLLFIAAAIGGTGFVWLKELLDAGYTSFHCLSGRYMVSCVFMSMLYIAKLRKLDTNALKKGFVLGLVLVAFFWVMLEGLRRTTPSVNAFLSNTQSIMVPFVAFILFKRKPSKKVFVSALMTVFGAWLLSFNGETDVSIGALLSLLSAGIFALQIVLLGNFVKGCNTIDLVLAENVTVFAVGALLSILKGEVLPPFEIDNLVSLILLGFFPTFIYFILQGIAQKMVSESVAGIIITSESVFAAFFSYFLYGERLSALAICGCAVIFAAILVVECDFNTLRRLTSSDKCTKMRT